MNETEIQILKLLLYQNKINVSNISVTDNRIDIETFFNGYFDFSTAICLIEAYFTKIVYNTEHNRITKPGKSKHKLRDLYSIYIL